MLRSSVQVPTSLRRTCRDVLAVSGWNASGTVIGLMSASPREGVTTLTLCMASILGETERVLVVDGSFGRRSAADMARLEKRLLTAADLPSLDAASLDGWIVSSDRVGFDLLSLEPSQRLAARFGFVWPRLRDAFSERYRVVLVDLGSLRTQLSAAWSSLVDRGFMVIDGSRTTIEDLASARQELDILKFPISGAILNRRSFPRPGWFGSGS